MMYGQERTLMAGQVGCLSQSVSADVVCSFHVRPTINENQKPSDHGFRVREADGVQQLEQRFVDDSWLALGTVQRFDRPVFPVFLHLPGGGHYDGRSRMLTVHKSGNASLAIHHGSSGGRLQIEWAWLYQGECE